MSFFITIIFTLELNISGIAGDTANIVAKFMDLIECSDIPNKKEILYSITKIKNENRYQINTHYSRYIF